MNFYEQYLYSKGELWDETMDDKWMQIPSEEIKNYSKWNWLKSCYTNSLKLTNTNSNITYMVIKPWVPV